MVTKPQNLNLDVDLKGGMLPISKAAQRLAALLKRSRAHRQPIIVTRKGYPFGVVLDLELFLALGELALLHRQGNASAEGEAAPSAPDVTKPAAAKAGKKRRAKQE